MSKSSPALVMTCMLVMTSALCSGQVQEPSEAKTDSLSLSQSPQASGEYVLELSHYKGKKVKTVLPGKKMKIWADGKMVSARIDRITQDSIYLGGMALSIAGTDKVRIRMKGFMYGGGTTIAVGAFIGVIGVVVIATGAAGLASEDAGAQIGGFLVAMVGMGITFAGAGFVLLGVPMLFIGKKFDMHKKWNIRSVYISRTA